MTTLQTQAADVIGLTVRPATNADRDQISNLMFFETHVHRHLDWRGPLDWLGRNPYWILERGSHIAAALACPTDPESVAWIRLFTFASELSGPGAWDRLWEAASHELASTGGATAAAIAAQPWFSPILVDSGFELVDDIVVLEWDPGPRRPPRVPPGVLIRPMSVADLPPVADVDAEAFDRLWCNSQEALTRAFAQASCASVCEDATGVVAYQLSTGSPLGTHLARLAVRPAYQRRGLGAALVDDLVAHLPPRGRPRLTVNTQSKNAASLSLYAGLNFKLTGEHYPVYVLRVESRGADFEHPGDGLKSPAAN